MEYILLLTACINPDGMPFTCLADVGVRKKQYIEALNFYLKNTTRKIVFVENSGTDISSSFKDFQAASDVYKRQEYAMAKSEFITDDVLIFKLTGRLQLININRLIHYMDKLSPSKNFVCVVPPQNNSVDSRCFVCNKYYLENICLKDKFHIDDSVGYYFEHLLFDSLRQNKGKIRIHKIPFFLYWRGISGSLGDRLIEPKCRYWSDFKALYHCMISKL